MAKGIMQMKSLSLALLFWMAGISSFAQYWMRSCGGPTIDEGLAIATGPQDETVTTGYFTNTAGFGNTTLTAYGVNDIFILKTDQAGIIQWVKKAGGASVDKGLAAAVDPSGHILVTGFYNGTAQFDSQTITSAGQQDIFVARYDPAGNLLWVQTAGGAGSDIGNDVKTDAFGNCYVTGEFTGSCTIGSVNLNSLNGSIDVFIAKYDPSGTLLWVRQGAGAGTDRGTDLAVDNNGNVYVSGMFNDTITFDQPHYTIISNAVFLVKYDASGQEQWFRWMGCTGQLMPGGLDSRSNRQALAGSFTGNMQFYGNGPAQTLTGPSTDNFFLGLYDEAGNLLWKTANGSTGNVSAEDVVIRSDQACVVGGNFNCRLTDFSAVYGTGTFCSVGYQDVFEAGYDSSGNWIWARNFGGPGEDYLHGICVQSSDRTGVTGSFTERLFSTFHPQHFNGYATTLFPGSGTFCNDSAYFNNLELFDTTATQQIFINFNTDLARQPMDYFMRQGANCLRFFEDIRICPLSGNCMDTLMACGQLDLRVDLRTNQAGPLFQYSWSNGQTTPLATVNTTGTVAVTVTSGDGCFSNTDSIYVVIHPVPPVPLISDSKGINFFNLNTVPVQICPPDSVILFAPNAGANTVNWSSFPSGQNPVTVTVPGSYTCFFTDSNGCQRTNSVQVTGALPLTGIYPQLICVQDTDRNDTIVICEGMYINMFPYDTISNPGAQLNCMPALSEVHWMYTMNGSNYNSTTDCGSPFGILSLLAAPPGNYTFLFTAWIVRSNACGMDSVYITKPLYVTVNPSPPPVTLNISISGPTEICFGDTIYLVASGGTNYVWNTGVVNDSLMVTASSSYFVSSTNTVTNGFGCSTISNGGASQFVSPVQQPVITCQPVSGFICPGDSIQLICSGTSGSFQWQGPGGTLADSINIVYANTPGFYYCVQTLSPSCLLVSNTLQVFQVTTPNYQMLPDSVICSGDSVRLMIYADSSALIMWYPPLWGTDFSQVVYTGGLYQCEVYHCNNLYTFTFLVTEDSGLATITGLDTSLTFCQGDSMLLAANTGMASYNWLPSGEQTQQIWVTTGGTVELTTVNTNGCRDTASITLAEQINNLLPPQVSDTVVCQGDSLLLTAFSPQPVNWALTAGYGNAFLQGNQFITPPLYAPITYYLFTDSGKCKSAFDSLHVAMAPPAHAGITPSDTSLLFCEGDSLVLQADTGMVSYLWLPDFVNSNTLTIDTTVTVFLIAGNAWGCRDTASISATMQENNLQPPFAADTVICEGESILIVAYGNGHPNWASAPDYNSLIQSGNPFQTPPLTDPVTYYLFADSMVCRSDFDSVRIGIETCGEIPDTSTVIIPDIFTPNDDGLNDFFPGFTRNRIVSLLVFNRWGSEVYHASNGYLGWNGNSNTNRPMADGTYFYLIEFEKNGQVKTARGMVLLRR